MKRSIPRGHVSPAFSRKLRGIGSRRHDASQKRLWKINVLPADVSAGVRSFVRLFAFSFPLLPFFFRPREGEYIALVRASFDFERRIEPTNISSSFFPQRGGELYHLRLIRKSFDFEKGGRNGPTNVPVDRYYYYRYYHHYYYYYRRSNRRDDSTPMIE